MSVINKIPRGLRVIIVMAVLAVLVWNFATGSFFYPGIGAAIIITLFVIFAVYRPLKNSSNNSRPTKQGNAALNKGSLTPDRNLESEKFINSNSSITDKSIQGYLKIESKPKATDIASKYLYMAKEAEKNRNSDDWQPASASTRLDAANQEPTSTTKDAEVAKTVPQSEPPVPLTEDETTLTIEEKNLLVNAVWYRCENPFCKYTRFLGVHHIVDEKAGGTNKLDNLIVLCPYCHELAHKNEIPEKEMRSWIANREERFKFKPEWLH